MTIRADCIEKIRHTNIKVEDRNRKVIFENPERLTYRRIRVDGCAVRDGLKADYVVEKGTAAVIIELKGRGVENGLKQAIETAKLWVREGRATKICGLVVGRGAPAASSTVQTKKLEFIRIAKGPVHICSGDRKLVFDNVFRSSGIERK